MIRKKVKRDKAFLGAIIGAVAGIGSAIAGGVIGKHSAEKAQRQQQIAQNRKDTYSMAQNLSNSYGNQEYVDEFNKRVTFKKGGKMNTKYDRLVREKKFACGGRKKACGGRAKAACGTRKKAAWGESDTSALISGLGSAGSSLASAAISSSINRSPIATSQFSGKPKEYLERPDYLVDNATENGYYFRAGGCLRSKAACGTKRNKAKCGTKK